LTVSQVSAGNLTLDSDFDNGKVDKFHNICYEWYKYKCSSYLNFIMREVLVLFGDSGRRTGVLTEFRLRKELIHPDL
jgi:hypothetical protein